MLKKMRRKFILAAMTAVFTIVMILSLMVNLWFATSITNQLDYTLAELLASEQHSQDPFRNGFPGKDKFPERPYMTRYFAVTFGDDGVVTHTSRDYIASITYDTAIEYASAVIDRGHEFGFYKGYRYTVSQTMPRIVVFLNAEIELSARNAVLIASCTVSALCMLLAFIIILLLSKRALDPYMRNIERQKQFITDAGHELKTPLTAIAASADVLALENEGSEWVGTIQTQVQRLSKLVNSLVTLSRLDEEQPRLEHSDFSLSDVIWEIAEPMASVAASKGLRFEQSIADGMTMRGDRDSIAQLVSILLDNAAKYCAPDGEIRLRAYKQHRDNVIEVYNTCTLSDPEHIERLFDRFYRPDKSRTSATGGNGIGLSIAKAIAEAHKGAITALTNNGEDISFVVKLKGN